LERGNALVVGKSAEKKEGLIAFYLSVEIFFM
jgi:hypothetical protein